MSSWQNGVTLRANMISHALTKPTTLIVLAVWSLARATPGAALDERS